MVLNLFFLILIHIEITSFLFNTYRNNVIFIYTYRNNVIFILVAERCVEVLVCMCFKVLKTLKIGCTEKPHLLKL